METLTILPCKEIIADRKRYHNAAQHASELLLEQLAKMTDKQAKTKLKEEIGHEIAQLEQHHHFPGIYKYISLLYPERRTLLDYVSRDSLLLIDEPARLIETSKQLERDEAELITGLMQEGKCLPAFVMAKTYDTLLHRKPFP